MSNDQLSEVHHPRPQWSSRLGFILAALGSAVGLGNIGAFPIFVIKMGEVLFLFLMSSRSL